MTTANDNNQEQLKAERHKARQQKLKAGVDAKIAAAQDEKGILLVLTGNGKGKSTSGFGTVARAVGHGKKAAVVQFIKGTWECGERNLLEGAGVSFHVMGTGFTWETQDKEKDTAAPVLAWEAAEALLAGQHNMAVQVLAGHGWHPGVIGIVTRGGAIGDPIEDVQLQLTNIGQQRTDGASNHGFLHHRLLLLWRRSPSTAR